MHRYVQSVVLPVLAFEDRPRLLTSSFKMAQKFERDMLAHIACSGQRLISVLSLLEAPSCCLLVVDVSRLAEPAMSKD